MKIIVNPLLLCILLCLCTQSCYTQEYSVTFKVDMTKHFENEKISIRGNIAPLTWDKDFPLTDDNQDGVYEATVLFKTSKNRLRYKFAKGTELELIGSDNRSLYLKAASQTVENTYDEFNFYSPEELAEKVFTKDEIIEDVKILKKTLTEIHPNLLKYVDNENLESNFTILEQEMLAEPTIPGSYKAVSKFLAVLKCSHTFTNPWNQNSKTKEAIFFQADKLPFTFTRLNKQIFIDKNASQNEELKKGMEVLSINGTPVEEILNALSKYITSDGNKEDKKLQRLTLAGESKFELFDIFFPLEYGTKSTFDLELKDWSSEKVISTSVKAISKTKRNRMIEDRYAGFKNNISDGWKFKIVEDKTGLLQINSFAVFSEESFDWKNFLDKGFVELNKKQCKNLIIDIRGNEGGENDVVEYLLERIIKTPVTIPSPEVFTAYQTLPEDLKPFVSTWSKLPYNWGSKVKKVGPKKYKVKSLYTGGSKTYKPKKNGFTGQTFLMTDATNSSATHIMATYIKRFELATIVGQETGGNQRGLNGGYLFFLTLPNTGVEVDVPLQSINLFPITAETPDAGISPDVRIEKGIEEFVEGKDVELNAVMELIRE